LHIGNILRIISEEKETMAAVKSNRNGQKSRFRKKLSSPNENDQLFKDSIKDDETGKRYIGSTETGNTATAKL
jgi:hypothetical protein